MDCLVIKFEFLTEKNFLCVSNFIAREMNMIFEYSDEGETIIVISKNTSYLLGVGFVRDDSLEYLCVSESYRGMGIGSKIVNQFLITRPDGILFTPTINVSKDENGLTVTSPSLAFYNRNFNIRKVGPVKYILESKN